MTTAEASGKRRNDPQPKGRLWVRKPIHWKARHTVLSIVCMTWIVTYIDRTVMSVAMPYIASDYHLGPFSSGAVMSVFFAGYAISQIPGGLLADVFGVRKVATACMLCWSLFTAATGATVNLIQLLTARLLFGLGEGVFPACAFKTIAVWFLKHERATVNARMLAASDLGMALAPLTVIPIMTFWGWRPVFYSLLLPGVLLAYLFWVFVPNKPSESSRVAAEELAEIEANGGDAAGAASKKVKFSTILKQPDLLKYFLVLFAYDTAYWGYSTWLPTYLVRARGFSMLQMGAAASLPPLVGMIGCIFGGWVSDKYFSNNRRFPIIFAQLIAAVLLYLTFTAGSSLTLVLYQTVAGFFLESFFSAFWALPMNTVPKEVMGVTSGFINMAGQSAAFISPMVIGYLVEVSGGSFALPFTFMIVSLLISGGIVLTISGKSRSQLNAAADNIP